MSTIQAELESWEAETGQPLPMPAAEIARIEATGRHVDLCTGEIVNPRVHLQTSIEVAGDFAGNVARILADAVNDGALDLAIVTMMRDAISGRPGDWLNVRCDRSAAEVQP